MFALRSIVFVGGTPALDAQVRAALAPELGRSLLRISGADVDAVAAGLPDVISLRFRRSFPDTLRVVVTPEHPALLVRRGHVGFVVSARGRVMSETAEPQRSSLPRMWVAKGTQLTPGGLLDGPNGLLAAAAAAKMPVGLVPGGVRFVTTSASGDITLISPSGFQVRLGGIGDLALKFAITQRIVAYAGRGLVHDTYIDVSVPERPVLGTENPQVAGIG